MQKDKIKPTHLKILRSALWGAATPLLIVTVEWLTYGLEPLVSKVSKPVADFIDQTFFGVNFLLSLPGVLLQFWLGIKPNRIVTYTIAALSMAVIFSLFTAMKERLSKSYDSEN